MGIYHKMLRNFLTQPKHLQTFPDLGFCFKFENQPGIVERFGNIFKLALSPALSQAGFLSKPCEWFLNDEKQWFHCVFSGSTKICSDLNYRRIFPTKSGKLRDFSSKVGVIRSCRSHSCFSSSNED